MPNDLTIADVQQMIRSELGNAVEEMKRSQSVITTDGTQTTIEGELSAIFSPTVSILSA